MMKENVKRWYLSAYATDEMGNELRDVSFADVFDALNNYKSVYKLLGVDDSLIRERVFQKLADLMDVTYDYVYGQWLLCRE